MSVAKNITLIVALIVIAGAIFFLEKTKTVVNLSEKEIEESTLFVDDVEEVQETQQEINENNTVVSEKAQTEIRQAKSEKEKLYERAKEISTPDAIINAPEDFRLADVIGKKIILVDFWTYSCINCQRTLPYLNNWHESYADDGLVIVGIHTPEFEFEEDYNNVVRAVTKWGIEYPVVMDNDRSTWQAYRNRYWPRKYLIDIDGFIVYDHIGEGAYDETEAKIVELLNEKNQRQGNGVVTMAGESPENVDQVSFEALKSKESYIGKKRIAYSANDKEDLKTCFTSPSCDLVLPEIISTGEFALEGTWSFDDEYAELVGEEGKLAVTFFASQVNLVVGSDEPVLGTVFLDGEFIKEIVFQEHDLYNLVDLNDVYEKHTLEVFFEEGGVRAYALTFG